MGLNESKPKVFEDLEDKIADVKASVAQNKDESEYRDNLMEQRMETLDRDMKLCVTDMKSMESLIKMRDAETARSNKIQDEVQMTLNKEIGRLENLLSNLEFRLSNSLTGFELKQEISSTKIVNFEAIMKEM